MKFGILAAVVTAMTAGSALAQTAPHDVKAREIFVKNIAFRTAEGQGQVPAIATYLTDVLKAGGVPDADIAILPQGETVAMLVRLPAAGRTAGMPILFSGAVGRTTAGETGAMLRAFAVDPQDAKAADYLAGQPEFVGTTRTTCVATMLAGGHAENALPQKATATVNCRLFPDVKVADVQAELARVVANPNVKFTILDDPQPSPVSEMRPDVTAAITRAVHAVYPGVPVVPYLESGGTDGKVYRAEGIPTFATSGVFMKPSDMFAHGLNERLPVKSFYEGVDHIYRLAKDLGGR